MQAYLDGGGLLLSRALTHVYHLDEAFLGDVAGVGGHHALRLSHHRLVRPAVQVHGILERRYKVNKYISTMTEALFNIYFPFGWKLG